VIARWRLGDQRTVKNSEARFDLKPGDYTLFFEAARALKARAYCNQRHVADQALELNGLSLASNRRFDAGGTETTGAGTNPPANALATHLFPVGPDQALGPANEWSLELPL
jgi:hypothetical protein